MRVKLSLPVLLHSSVIQIAKQNGLDAWSIDMRSIAVDGWRERIEAFLTKMKLDIETTIFE